MNLNKLLLDFTNSDFMRISVHYSSELNREPKNPNSSSVSKLSSGETIRVCPAQYPFNGKNFKGFKSEIPILSPYETRTSFDFGLEIGKNVYEASEEISSVLTDIVLSQPERTGRDRYRVWIKNISEKYKSKSPLFLSKSLTSSLRNLHKKIPYSLIIENQDFRVVYFDKGELVVDHKDSIKTPKDLSKKIKRSCDVFKGLAKLLENKVVFSELFESPFRFKGEIREVGGGFDMTTKIPGISDISKLINESIQKVMGKPEHVMINHKLNDGLESVTNLYLIKGRCEIESRVQLCHGSIKKYQKEIEETQAEIGLILLEMLR